MGIIDPICLTNNHTSPIFSGKGEQQAQEPGAETRRAK
jgi:hypothetical protein